VNRRSFQISLVAALTSAAPLARAATAGKRTPVVFDAMGEVRPIYPMTLIDEILASGTRAIAITLTDPKTELARALPQLRDDTAAYDAYFRAHPDRFLLARTAADIDRAQRDNKLAVFYLIQNSTPVGDDLNNVRVLKEMGLTSIQLTYNDRNLVGSGCFEANDPGLSEFGRALVARMNQDRMIVDLSHAGMETMAQAIAASNAPVIISHTCCKALRNHPRNTTDVNLRALAKRGGVVGITQIRTFLTDAKRDNLGVYFAHIDHAVNVAGTEHVGIGSDRDHRVIPDSEDAVRELLREEGAQFKPDDWPLYLDGLNGPRRMETIRDGLRKRGYRAAAIDKLMGENLRRIYRDVVG
jgi:membrane dipeptidase